jgi:hypothetical protein
MKPIIKGSTTLGFHPNHEDQRSFKTKTIRNTIIYTTPDFPELLATGYRMNATVATVKHGGYKQVLSIDGCKPQH